MASFTFLPIVPVCTLSTLGMGKGQLPRSQVASVSMTLLRTDSWQN